MGLEPINVIYSSGVPLPIENIDTDQIIPARFLKAITKQGMGDALFADWRFDKLGKPINDFVLNQKKYSGKILVAGKNFGCGSSREHAVWAIADYGFKAVVSSFFADIFKNNALNNNLLVVQVSDNFLSTLLDEVFACPESNITIDLPNENITIDKIGKSEQFPINPFKKKCLLEGLDNMSFLLNQRNKIIEYEEKHNLIS